jgi:hypothetical protein
MKKYKLIGLSVFTLFIFLTLSPIIVSEETANTELEISDIRGGLAGVTADIKNIGEVPAEHFLITISVQGGILNRIDVFKECGGCGDCSTIIQPGEIKSETTLEGEVIIGFGSIDVTVTASAENADLVSQEITGFIIGPFIIL